MAGTFRKLLGFSLLIVSMSALAKAPEPFLNASLEEAEKANKYVLIHFFADWCPSCQAQKKILDKVMVSDDDLRKVVFLVVAYDDELAVRKKFSVDRQSTLILMKGKHEIAREAGITSKAKLLGFLKQHVDGD
jgi:thioredoxin 1